MHLLESGLDVFRLFGLPDYREPKKASSMHLNDLRTPALLLDEVRLEANLARMAARAASLGVTLRPR
jgi:D-serine deaminase-like pyridoxal phosphate-dependent protein